MLDRISDGRIMHPKLKPIKTKFGKYQTTGYNSRCGLYSSVENSQAGMSKHNFFPQVE